jgi:hypothetical protein
VLLATLSTVTAQWMLLKAGFDCVERADLSVSA